MSGKARVFEVGIRDGFQNEPKIVSTDDKFWFANALRDAGIKDLELGAFVRTDRVPQMADSAELFQRFNQRRLPTDRLWALVPNLQGLERAIAAKVRSVAVFTAASETFNQKNIGMSVKQSWDVISEIVKVSKKSKIQVRGYVSTAFGCPFEGKIAPKKTLACVEKLAEMGIGEISIGDTIGVADPVSVEKVVRPAVKAWPSKKIAMHFHDTRGTALANILRSLDLGIRIFDSSAGGLGGCPFAPGAAGNVATEDLVYMFDQMGIQTGIDFHKLCTASIEMARRMGRPLTSKALQAFSHVHR